MNEYEAEPTWTTSDNFGSSFYDQNLASSSTFDPFYGDVSNSKQQQEPLQDEFKAEPMTVKVDDAQKSPDGAFITFRVFTMTNLEIYSQDKRPVRRRFRDFLWLHNALTIEFPACVIPPLPEKHRMKYVKGDRFNPMFIEQRRLGLQWFMDRIARHPLLQSSTYTRIFLESTDFTYAKVKKPDEKFVEMKESIDKFGDNLNIVEKLYSRIGKRQQELETNYGHFAGSIRGLSALESNVDQPLRQFAEATESYVDALKEMRKQEDLLFLNDVHELLNYCNAAKDKLAERDQKQVDFEDMSTSLQAIMLEKERILHPNKGSANMNISEFMTDKMNDHNRARNERLFRLDTKIKELEENVAKANDDNNSYSSQMIKEYDIFQRAREIELKQGLTAYADCHIDFYKKSISIWENILPVLDQLED
ncbi:uncharacterized protein EV154DRAFT_537471 [Mucor mucedo]|uniref:uncharacterized protein n=1 Tax=Mucor mucedo TaxID=29922 RepID=UPI00222019EA|nr:uncharacterized protein EV154DRAFT_537471 [Mucor mucedo]KAI7892498.1 hypothetical protein EV154DRAFT_537471 [Mucor mucedo]